MNTLARIALVSLLPCSPLLSTSALAQGSLTPPGAPGPTMKTLDQLDAKLTETTTKLDQTEPRRPIASLPFQITESGSYYFTGNLHFTAASGHAINVSAPNVTIDLMGFTLSSAPEVTGDAINFGAQALHCAVKNGIILGASSVTGSGGTLAVTRAGFNFGIRDARRGRFAELTIMKCRDLGAFVRESALDGCVLMENGGSGLLTFGPGVVSNCVVTLNGGNGIMAAEGSVTNSMGANNQGTGIIAATITGSTARGNGGSGMGGGNTETVANCSAVNNGDDGIVSYAVSTSTARGNGGTGIVSAHAQACTAWENGVHGIHIRPPLLDSGSNGGAAIANVSSRNGRLGNGAGIYIEGNGTRVEGNNCHDNDWGIQSTTGSNAFIVRNSCRSNPMAPMNAGATGNYDFNRGSNTFGPVVVVDGDMSANAAASHPAANIQF